jgi:hypothetical protein
VERVVRVAETVMTAVGVDIKEGVPKSLEVIEIEPDTEYVGKDD